MQFQVNASRLVRCHTVYKHIIRIVCEHFSCIMYSVIIISDCGEGCPKIQLSYIILCFLCRLVKVNVHLRKILIIAKRGSVVRKYLHLSALRRSVPCS